MLFFSVLTYLLYKFYDDAKVKKPPFLSLKRLGLVHISLLRGEEPWVEILLIDD